MRFVVFGVGAIGGVVVARLALSGHEVLGIARGRQFDATRTNGLLLRSPEGTERARFPVAPSAAEAGFRKDDWILLTVKGQDTAAALKELCAAGVHEQPIFCCQNGVDNERQAAALFPSVYAVTVMTPVVYRTPGEIAAFGSPRRGIFDIGCYPKGCDDRARRLAKTLDTSGFSARAHNDVMRSKYRKLLSNLWNAVEAVLDNADARLAWMERAKGEGEAVLSAAGIPWDEGPIPEERRALMQEKPVHGADRTGSSSLQSLVRATGSIETDYLNGEIVRIGRRIGMPTPINAALCRFSADIVSGPLAPQSISSSTFEQLVKTVA